MVSPHGIGAGDEEANKLRLNIIFALEEKQLEIADKRFFGFTQSVTGFRQLLLCLQCFQVDIEYEEKIKFA